MQQTMWCVASIVNLTLTHRQNILIASPFLPPFADILVFWIVFGSASKIASNNPIDVKNSSDAVDMNMQINCKHAMAT